jgi:mannose-6-phosphate isomerase
MDKTAPYPLLLEPILMEKVWGGRRLEKLGKRLAPGALVGESWELADLASTSPSGGGGGAARSVIANGPLAGRTLHDALGLWGSDLLGRGAPTFAEPKVGGTGRYPLLVKFLDARENLSVQVHPSPAYAATNPEAHLKTECWYILDAAPGSVIYKGIRAGVTRERFARDIEAGTVVDDLIAVPATPGECHTLPSGTVHALGAGVLVAEVQTPSDTTFRVYDWGRKGRALHVDEALACIDFGPAPAAVRRTGPSAVLAKTEFFSVREVETASPVRERCDALMVLRGSGTLKPLGAEFEPVPLKIGATVAVPRALEGRWTAAPAPGGIGYLAVSLGGTGA